jgi:hypothetical protein
MPAPHAIWPLPGEENGDAPDPEEGRLDPPEFEEFAELAQALRIAPSPIEVSKVATWRFRSARNGGESLFGTGPQDCSEIFN